MVSQTSRALKSARLIATQPPGQSQSGLVVGVCVFLALAVLAVFGQTAHFEFVCYDDDKNIYQNPTVAKGLSWSAVGWAFTHAQVANWIPLTTLSHLLDCSLFGLHAGGPHLVNVLWHAANAVLLFLVLRQMTGRLWRCAFVAAVFAVHPLRAESVAWVSERKDVLSAFFFILSIGAYVRQVRRPSKAGYVLLLVLFALGLMAKSMVATLPLVLLLLDYWPLGRWQTWRQLPRLAGEKLPLLALAAGACAVTAFVPGLVLADVHRLPLSERLGNALVGYVVYLRQMVFPVGLAIPYPDAPNGRPAWEIILALAILAAISAGVVAGRKQHPALLVGWLWYLGMLLPVIGLIPILYGTTQADRYTYLPGIGLVLAGTWAVTDGCAVWKQRRVVLGGWMMAVIAALAVCAHRQTAFWQDDTTLWTRALACTSGNSVAHNNLGLALAKQGQPDAALTQFNQALKIRPDDGELHYNAGVILALQGKVDEALAQYQTAVALAPDRVDFHNNLGTALFAKGSVAESIAQFQAALRLQPDDADARYNLGNALANRGQLDEAIAQYRQVLAGHPDHENARHNLTAALALKAARDQAAAPPK